MSRLKRHVTPLLSIVRMLWRGREIPSMNKQSTNFLDLDLGASSAQSRIQDQDPIVASI